MANAKQPIIITPRCNAAYAWLAKPDTKYKEDGEYKLTCVLDKADLGPGRLDYGNREVSGQDFIAHILELAAANGVESDPTELGCPVKDGDGYRNGKGKLVQKEEFAGKWLIAAKTRYQPGLVDTKLNPLPDNLTVFSGDIVKAAIKPNIGKGDDGAYMSMFLTKVMLVEKNADRDGGANMFGEEEGFEVATTAEPSVDFGGTDETDGDF